MGTSDEGSRLQRRGLFVLFYEYGYLAVAFEAEKQQSSSALFILSHNMKHYYIKFTLLCLSLLAGTKAALADTVEINGIYYNLIAKAKQAEVTKNPNEYNYYKGDVKIPETVIHEDKVYTVTQIGEGAFAWCSWLTSINIPNSVTSIGGHAFNGCI